MIRSPWRRDFPALATLAGRGEVYLDTAATAQKPQVMLDALQDYYACGAANVHRAQHGPGNRATAAFERTRQLAARYLGVANPQQLIFTRNSTEALNLLAYGLENSLQPGDNLLVGASEHHANLLPWQQLARRRGAELRILPLLADGRYDPEAAPQLFDGRSRLLAVSPLSNVLGRRQSLQPLLARARTQGVITVVDGAQSAVHARPDIERLGCDFHVCSAHKLYGPEGVGLLYGRSEALECLQYWQFGGEMVARVDYQSASFQPPPLGFEAGTPAIGPVIAFGAVLEYLMGLDSAAVQAHEAALHAELCRQLERRPGIQILGRPDTALACFSVGAVHPADLAMLLGEQGIAVRAGSHCAQPLFTRLGLPGAIRVSLGLYTDSSDLERFFTALDGALEILQ